MRSVRSRQLALNPYKARVLLMLALAAGGTGPVALQKIFDTY
jgi:L-asparaginase